MENAFNVDTKLEGMLKAYIMEGIHQFWFSQYSRKGLVRFFWERLKKVGDFRTAMDQSNDFSLILHYFTGNNGIRHFSAQEKFPFVPKGRAKEMCAWKSNKKR